MPGEFSIASGHPESAAVGQAVLTSGGNAFDAAVTVAFLQGVVDPAKCGIGGWGTAVCLPAGASEAVAVDFPAVAGSRSRPDQWADLIEADAYHGYLPVLRGNVNDVGYGAIGVPSAVAGFATIHGRFGSGRVPWRALLEPAIRVARDGIAVVDGVLGAGTPEWDWPGAVPLPGRLGWSQTGARRYLRDGELLHVGDVLIQPELASTLEALAAGGPDDFYRGGLAARIARDLEHEGSAITAEDLASCQPRVRPALHTRFEGRSIFGSWPPESGVSIAQALIALEGQLVRSLGAVAAPNAGLVAEVLDWIAAERARELGDPVTESVDVAGMLDRARRRTRHNLGASLEASTHTTSVVVVDAEGGAIAMNHSLAASAGSGVVTDGLGFLYNNAMAGFDARPGQRNSIAPGKARWSAACPTVVTGPTPGAALAVTAPGGSRAVAAVLQVLVDVMVFGLDPASALDLPRYDAHDAVVDVEPALDQEVRDAFAARGRQVVVLPTRQVAAGYVALRESEGSYRAGADPRWPGSARVA
jgi:gamma-glutamyltranspeptidase/glutathione hydrolase